MMRRMTVPIWRVFGIVLLIAVGAAVRLGLSAELTAPDPSHPTLVQRGKVVYDEHCASCHGAKLEGQPNWRHPLPNGKWPALPHDPSGHTWHHSDKVLFEVTKHGMKAMVPDRESDMPGFADKLSDADIGAVLSYIEGTWPPEIRQKQQRMNQEKH
jgi:mono/diheme cytochrome c family protein